MISLTSTIPGRRPREEQRHDGPCSRSLGKQFDRARQGGMDAGRRRTLEAGRKAEAFVCRLQWHAKYGIGCAGGRDAAADPAHSGRGSGGIQRDETEFRFLARILRGHKASASSGYFPALSGERSAEARWSGGVRRVDVQE